MGGPALLYVDRPSAMCRKLCSDGIGSTLYGKPIFREKEYMNLDGWRGWVFLLAFFSYFRHSIVLIPEIRTHGSNMMLSFH